MHPNPQIEAWRQLYAAHECVGGCGRNDRQHWYFPRSSFKGIAKEFTRLTCVDWPNVEYVCFYWHHSIFNPEFDKPKFSPELPSVSVMQLALRRHNRLRTCGCYEAGEEDYDLCA